jgi:hypothetical protein
MEENSQIFPASINALGIFEQQGQMIGLPLFQNGLQEEDGMD